MLVKWKFECARDECAAESAPDEEEEEGQLELAFGF